MLRRSKADRGGGGPARVLVVQDDPDAAELLRRVLERGGYEVLLVTSPDDALGTARTEHPDIAVIDLGGTGPNLKLLDSLRQARDPAVAGLRVVMLARQGSNPMFSWQSGIDGFLDRPFHADQLVGEVEAVLARSEADRPRHRREQLERAKADGDRRG